LNGTKKNVNEIDDIHVWFYFTLDVRWGK
jgi:hypothetical protein